MSSTAYTVDLDDIKFVLFDQLDIDKKLCEAENFEDYDQETYESILEEASTLATELMAPINGPGDRQGCSLDDSGNVTTPTATPRSGRRSPREGGSA